MRRLLPVFVALSALLAGPASAAPAAKAVAKKSVNDKGSFKQLANAGIVRIVYGEFYRDERIFEVAKQIQIELVHVPLPGVNFRKWNACAAAINSMPSTPYALSRICPFFRAVFMPIETKSS